VEILTGVKAHTLRYMESVVPTLAPQKDAGNRRMYTPRDVAVFRRLAYLTGVRRLSVEDARTRLMEEQAAASHSGDAVTVPLQTLGELREELFALWARAKK
jgi:DNA-binding transcriptional MerR regulator